MAVITEITTDDEDTASPPLVKPPPQSGADQYNELLSQMAKTKEQWDEQDAGVKDPEDQLLSQAIELALEQGRGWSPGEKEAYLETILDDDFIPPMFANTVEEVEKSGLQDAFTSLIYDDESPTSLMLQFKKKGGEAFANGKRNQVNNKQYYRDAINHYLESLAWADKIQPINAGDLAQADTDEPTYSPVELDQAKSALCSNIALMHLQLKNWGHARTYAQKAIDYDDKTNIKAWYRLAKAQEELQNYEGAGAAIDSGLQVDSNNTDLIKLQTKLQFKIRQARKVRQERERKRAQRAVRIKQVWKHAQALKIRLGRVPLICVEEEDDEQQTEWRWNHHLPHSGQLPSGGDSGNDWTWPVMFLYPSHQQSDYIAMFAESEMLALRMAQIFPELDDGVQETAVPWDRDNQFTCSQLAVYFEVHETADPPHPDSVQILKDQVSCMRFYEASRVLKGDEGPELADVIRAVERKHVHKLQRAYKRVHKTLWHRPDPSPVVRVHPAATLQQVLQHSRMVVPNFLVTFLLFPQKHPAHEDFLKERKCLGILQPPPE